MSTLNAPPEPSWHEYPLGIRGQFATSAAGVLTPLLIGIAVTFGLVLVAGYATEEGVLDDPLLSRSIDQLTRFSLLSMAVVAWSAELLRRLALGVRDTEVSRAVHAAAGARAPRRLVPHPRQVETVTTKPWSAFSAWSLTHVVILGSVGILWLVYLMFDPFVVGGWILLAIAAVAGLHGLAIVLIRTRVTPAHRARHRDIGAWWTTEDGRAAWERARTVRRADGEVAAAAPRGRQSPVAGFRRVAGLQFHPSLSSARRDTPRCTTMGGWSTRAASTTRSLDRTLDRRRRGVSRGRHGSRRELGVIGTVVEGAALSQEREHLRRAASGPTAPRPAATMLTRHTRDGAPHWAQAVAVMAASSLTLGLTGVVLGTARPGGLGDTYDGVENVFPDRLPFFGLLAAGGAMLLVVALLGTWLALRRHRELRDILIQRWPVVPESEESDDDKGPPLARFGPALSAPPDTYRTSPAGGTTNV